MRSIEVSKEPEQPCSSKTLPNDLQLEYDYENKLRAWAFVASVSFLVIGFTLVALVMNLGMWLTVPGIFIYPFAELWLGRRRHARRARIYSRLN